MTFPTHYQQIVLIKGIQFRCPWWRHQIKAFSALLAICAGNSPVTGEFPTQRPVTRNFGVFFDRCLNKHLSKQSWGWWFETPSRALWRHCNATTCQRLQPTFMKTSWCENAFRITGVLGRESIGQRWIPHRWQVTGNLNVFLVCSRHCLSKSES